MPVALETYQSTSEVILKTEKLFAVRFVSLLHQMSGKSPLVFIDEGLEINSQVYKKLLHEEVLP